MIEALPAADLAKVAASGADRDPALREAAEAFEGYLVGALLRFGARPLDPDAPLVGGPAQRMYRELFFDEISKLAAVRGGFGIARLVSEAATQREAGS